MPTCRLIFRLDFDLNFDIIEHPGEVMRLISQVSGDDWSELSENPRNRGISSTYTSSDRKVVSDFTVEPQSIIASYETADGVNIKKLVTEDNFLLLTKLADATCEKFHINEIRRSGIRIFSYGKCQNKGKVFSSYRSFINNNLIGGIEDSIGEILDYGINLDGSSNEGIKYHCHTGPLNEDEDYKKYFNHIPSSIIKPYNWDFIIDLDLYEADIAISKIPMHKWFRPKIEKASDLITHIKSTIEGT